VSAHELPLGPVAFVVVWLMDRARPAATGIKAPADLLGGPCRALQLGAGMILLRHGGFCTLEWNIWQAREGRSTTLNSALASSSKLTQ